MADCLSEVGEGGEGWTAGEGMGGCALPLPVARGGVAAASLCQQSVQVFIQLTNLELKVE